MRRFRAARRGRATTPRLLRHDSGRRDEADQQYQFLHGQRPPNMSQTCDKLWAILRRRYLTSPRLSTFYFGFGPWALDLHEARERDGDLALAADGFAPLHHNRRLICADRKSVE